MEDDLTNEININISDDDEININNSDIIPMNLLDEFKKSICKIIVGGGSGTGFLVKLKNKKNFIYYCITCEHVITKKCIESKKEIEIDYNYNNKKFEMLKINLDGEKRFIRRYQYLGVDATAVQIFENEIDDTYFYFLEKDNFNIAKDFKNDIGKFKNRPIFIFQIPNNYLSYSTGKITSNRNLTCFYHSSSTIPGSSGSPILIYANNKINIIGIHRAGDNKTKLNIGNYIESLLDSLVSNRIYMDIENFTGELIENGGRKGRLVMNENEYYVGDIMNSIPHGKGALYKNNMIKYFGDFINGKYEGKGTLYYSNGEHYKGNFKNNKREGEGKLYRKNEEIQYDGEFKDDKYDGHGTIYYEDGSSNKGHFSKGEIEKVKSEECENRNNFKKGNLDNIINSFLGIIHPIGKQIGFDTVCGNCNHSINDHDLLEGTIWECKKCGSKCNNSFF